MFNNKKGLCHDSFNRSNHALMRMRQRNVVDADIDRCIDWGILSAGKSGAYFLKDSHTTVVVDPQSKLLITTWHNNRRGAKYHAGDSLKVNKKLAQRACRRKAKKDLATIDIVEKISFTLYTPDIEVI